MDQPVTPKRGRGRPNEGDAGASVSSSIKISAAEDALLDELASALKISRNGVVRRAIAELAARTLR